MTRPTPTSIVSKLCALALVAGCGDALNFELKASVDEFTVLGDPILHHQGAPLSVLDVPPIELKFGALQQGGVYLADLTFYVTDTSISSDRDDDDLDFLTKLQVVATPTNPNSQLPPVPIAQWTGPPPEVGTMEIELTVNTQINLRPYITEGFALKLSTAGTIPYDDVSVKGEVRFTVKPL